MTSLLHIPQHVWAACGGVVVMACMVVVCAWMLYNDDEEP